MSGKQRHSRLSTHPTDDTSKRRKKKVKKLKKKGTKSRKKRRQALVSLMTDTSATEAVLASVVRSDSAKAVMRAFATAHRRPPPLGTYISHKSHTKRLLKRPLPPVPRRVLVTVLDACSGVVSAFQPCVYRVQLAALCFSKPMSELLKKVVVKLNEKAKETQWAAFDALSQQTCRSLRKVIGHCESIASQSGSDSPPLLLRMVALDMSKALLKSAIKKCENEKSEIYTNGEITDEKVDVHFEEATRFHSEIGGHSVDDTSDERTVEGKGSESQTAAMRMKMRVIGACNRRRDSDTGDEGDFYRQSLRGAIDISFDTDIVSSQTLPRSPDISPIGAKESDPFFKAKKQKLYAKQLRICDCLSDLTHLSTDKKASDSQRTAHLLLVIHDYCYESTEDSSSDHSMQRTPAGLSIIVGGDAPDKELEEDEKCQDQNFDLSGECSSFQPTDEKGMGLEMGEASSDQMYYRRFSSISRRSAASVIQIDDSPVAEPRSRYSFSSVDSAPSGRSSPKSSSVLFKKKPSFAMSLKAKASSLPSLKSLSFGRRRTSSAADLSKTAKKATKSKAKKRAHKKRSSTSALSGLSAVFFSASTTSPAQSPHTSLSSLKKDDSTAMRKTKSDLLTAKMEKYGLGLDSSPEVAGEEEEDLAEDLFSLSMDVGCSRRGSDGSAASGSRLPKKGGTELSVSKSMDHISVPSGGLTFRMRKSSDGSIASPGSSRLVDDPITALRLLSVDLRESAKQQFVGSPMDERLLTELGAICLIKLSNALPFVTRLCTVFEVLNCGTAVDEAKRLSTTSAVQQLNEECKLSETSAAKRVDAIDDERSSDRRLSTLVTETSEFARINSAAFLMKKSAEVRRRKSIDQHLFRTTKMSSAHVDDAWRLYRDYPKKMVSASKMQLESAGKTVPDAFGRETQRRMTAGKSLGKGSLLSAEALQRHDEEHLPASALDYWALVVDANWTPVDETECARRESEWQTQQLLAAPESFGIGAAVVEVERKPTEDTLKKKEAATALIVVPIPTETVEECNDLLNDLELEPTPKLSSATSGGSVGKQSPVIPSVLSAKNATISGKPTDELLLKHLWRISTVAREQLLDSLVCDYISDGYLDDAAHSSVSVCDTSTTEDIDDEYIVMEDDDAFGFDETFGVSLMRDEHSLGSKGTKKKKKKTKKKRKKKHSGGDERVHRRQMSMEVLVSSSDLIFDQGSMTLPDSFVIRKQKQQQRQRVSTLPTIGDTETSAVTKDAPMPPPILSLSEKCRGRRKARGLVPERDPLRVSRRSKSPAVAPPRRVKKKVIRRVVVKKGRKKKKPPPPSSGKMLEKDKDKDLVAPTPSSSGTKTKKRSSLTKPQTPTPLDLSSHTYEDADPSTDFGAHLDSVDEREHGTAHLGLGKPKPSSESKQPSMAVPMKIQKSTKPIITKPIATTTASGASYARRYDLMASSSSSGSPGLYLSAGRYSMDAHSDSDLQFAAAKAKHLITSVSCSALSAKEYDSDSFEMRRLRRKRMRKRLRGVEGTTESDRRMSHEIMLQRPPSVERTFDSWRQQREGRGKAHSVVNIDSRKIAHSSEECYGSLPRISRSTTALTAKAYDTTVMFAKACGLCVEHGFLKVKMTPSSVMATASGSGEEEAEEKTDAKSTFARCYCYLTAGRSVLYFFKDPLTVKLPKAAESWIYAPLSVVSVDLELKHNSAEKSIRIRNVADGNAWHFEASSERGFKRWLSALTDAMRR